MKKTPYVPCTRLKIIMMNTGLTFYAYFYGLTERDLYLVPNPYLKEFMRRRGIRHEDAMTSLMWVEKVR